MTLVDPNRRWVAPRNRPNYAGLLTFAESPFTDDPADLREGDVAVLGAPTDVAVYERPGARYGPRAIRAASSGRGANLEAGVDGLEQLRVIDYGDAAVVPADAIASHDAIAALVTEVVAAGALPFVLGGDHSITAADVPPCAERHGPLGLLHFDTHADSATEVSGVPWSHGTPMRRIVESGAVDPRRYVQVGLRGYWPGEEEFAWQAEQGITSLGMDEVRRRGIGAVIREAIETIGAGPTFVTIDIDVLDPAYAPGTGAPQPGGLTSGELMWACRTAASELAVVGADLAEVIPTAVGQADVTATVAERVVRETLNGIALYRRR